MSGLLRVVCGLFVIAALGWAASAILSPQQSPARATVIGLTPGDQTRDRNFARAYAPREFVFPRDHGPHPDYQTEWWYYTGNLTDAGGRHFGYQLTFFRRALIPQDEMPARLSDLASNQIYFTHFAVTDSAADRHVAFEKFSRGAAGLAGASGEPFKVFIEDWSALALDQQGDAVRLTAQSGAYSLTLDLRAAKPIVKHGNGGLSPKSEAPGNASYYYSFTRLEAQGRVKTADGAFDVTGLSWMDHEWSTSALGANAQGWDWFSLQLSDRRELMFFQIRNTDGSVEAVSGGALVAPDGSTAPLAREQVQIEVLDKWRSPTANAEYPVRWRIAIPAQDIQLELDARVRDQHMDLSVSYWEGAVKVRGQVRGAPVTGVGYVELTGYSHSLNGRF